MTMSERNSSTGAVPHGGRGGSENAAMNISLERRVEGLAYVLDRVRKSYEGQPIELQNLLVLVEKVAEALEREDLQAVAVHGLRLLDLAEIAGLTGILEAPDD